MSDKLIKHIATLINNSNLEQERKLANKRELKTEAIAYSQECHISTKLYETPLVHTKGGFSTFMSVYTTEEGKYAVVSNDKTPLEDDFVRKAESEPHSFEKAVSTANKMIMSRIARLDIPQADIDNPIEDQFSIDQTKFRQDLKTMSTAAIDLYNKRYKHVKLDSYKPEILQLSMSERDIEQALKTLVEKSPDNEIVELLNDGAFVGFDHRQNDLRIVKADEPSHVKEQVMPIYVRSKDRLVEAYTQSKQSMLDQRFENHEFSDEAMDNIKARAKKMAGFTGKAVNVVVEEIKAQEVMELVKSEMNDTLTPRHLAAGYKAMVASDIVEHNVLEQYQVWANNGFGWEKFEGSDKGRARNGFLVERGLERRIDQWEKAGGAEFCEFSDTPSHITVKNGSDMASMHWSTFIKPYKVVVEIGSKELSKGQTTKRPSAAPNNLAERSTISAESQMDAITQEGFEME